MKTEIEIKATKMLIISLICKINFELEFKQCMLLIMRYTYSKNVYNYSYNADVTDLAAPMKMTLHVYMYLL